MQLTERGPVGYNGKNRKKAGAGMKLLSGNMLKIIAAIAMVIDHAGMLLFPRVTVLRIIGRLAYPIFAFMIAEGCRYTKNKVKYLGGILGMGILCQIVYFVAMGSTYMCILITFSFTIAVIYGLQSMKCAWLCGQGSRVLTTAVFLLGVALTWLANQYLTIDYGFWGCMVGVFAAVLHPVGDALKRFDRTENHVLMLAVGLLLLAIDRGGVQTWSLLAVPLLLLYSGKRGKLRMKYFFYIFYPAHLVALQGIAWLLG